MRELRVDPEFRDKIPPLTDAEFEQLRENILSDGEVYEPIVVWNGTIIDGHNRWRIIQEHPEIPYKVKEMEFADKWEATEWMCKKQLGRRNLTDAQQTYLRGKMYEARKKSITNEKGVNQYTKEVEDQNDPQPKPRSTAEAIAREIGVAEPTVKRSGEFAAGLDRAEEVVPGFKDEVLSGKTATPKANIRAIRKLETAEEVKAAVEEIRNPQPKPRPQSKEMKEFNKKLNDIVEVMENGGTEYTLDDAVCDLNSAEDTFLMQIRFVLTERKSVVNTERGREEFEHFIKTVIDDLNELKGELM